jgi:hypothetical protein
MVAKPTHANGLLCSLFQAALARQIFLTGDEYSGTSEALVKSHFTGSIYSLCV